MSAPVLRVNPRRPERRSIERAAAALREGKLVAFPTDTVYGVGALAVSEKAVRRLSAVKGRPSDKPLAFLIRGMADARKLAAPIEARVRAVMERFWPGPLTLVLPASPLGVLLTGGKKTIGLRVPGGAVARALTAAVGVPVAATSANRSGEPAAVTARSAAAGVGTKVSLILDGGRTSLGRESTVLDVSSFPYRFLRVGAGAERLKKSLT